MKLIKEIYSLAQHLDGLGLIKEADVLDGVANSILKESSEEDESDQQFVAKLFWELFEQNVEHLVSSKGVSLEDAIEQATRDIQDLQEEPLEEATDEEREKARDLMLRSQLPYFSSRDESSEN